MIRESGRVVAVEADALWVETIRQTSCNSCSAQKGCGHGLLNKVASSKRNHLRVLLPAKFQSQDFALNDEVELSIPETLLVSAAMIVYILPLVMMLAGAVLASAVWVGDIAALLGAIVGFALGFILVRCHAWRNQNNSALQPVVVANLSMVSVEQAVNIASWQNSV